MVRLILPAAMVAGCASAYFYEENYCPRQIPGYSQDDSIKQRAYEIPPKGDHSSDYTDLVFEMDRGSSCGVCIGGPCFIPFIPFPFIALSSPEVTVRAFHKGERQVAVRFVNLRGKTWSGTYKLSSGISPGRSDDPVTYISVQSIFRGYAYITAENTQVQIDGVWKDYGPVQIELQPYRAIVLRFVNDIESGRNNVQWVIENRKQCRRNAY